MLRHRERVVPGRVAAPAVGSGEAEGKVLVRPVEGRGIEQVEATPGGKAHPGAGRGSGHAMPLKLCGVLSYRRAVYRLKGDSEARPPSGQKRLSVGVGLDNKGGTQKI